MNRIISIFLLLAIIASCSKENSNTKNHLPKAAFSVVPHRAEAGDTILFDAGIVTDKEDKAQDLEVQWSWIGNQVFTEYTTIKQAKHAYSSEGVYFPKLRVRDTNGMTDTISGLVVIVHDMSNLPPDKPILIFPPEWQEWVSTSITFKWKEGVDPEDDIQSFDLWVGKSINGLILMRANIQDFTIVGTEKIYETTLSGFALRQDYYWMVAAKDANGNFTRSDVWKFVTRPTPE